MSVADDVGIVVLTTGPRFYDHQRQSKVEGADHLRLIVSQRVGDGVATHAAELLCEGLKHLYGEDG